MSDEIFKNRRVLDLDDGGGDAPAAEIRAALERARGLIFVAVSGTAEAADAAHEACRLLFDHGILNFVELPASSLPAVPRSQGRRALFPSQVEPPAPSLMSDLLAITVGIQKVDSSPTWRRLASKFEGNCRSCAARYAVGEVVWWLRGYGCHCAKCGPGESP